MPFQAAASGDIPRAKAKAITSIVQRANTGSQPTRTATRTTTTTATETKAQTTRKATTVCVNIVALGLEMTINEFNIMRGVYAYIA